MKVVGLGGGGGREVVTELVRELRPRPWLSLFGEVDFLGST